MKLIKMKAKEFSKKNLTSYGEKNFTIWEGKTGKYLKIAGRNSPTIAYFKKK